MSPAETPAAAGRDRPKGPPDLALDAPGKVNLFLEVLGKRPDGYHEIETVMQAVDLADRVELWKRPAGELSISVAGDAPADESNLALQAARLVLAESGAREGLHVHLEKRVPTGGGMGGGSSDAAAVLRGASMLWKLGGRLADLEKLGARLGSDVNFFLHGGLAVCRGRGEIVEPVRARLKAAFVLCFPGIHLCTRKIYEAVRIPLTGPRLSCTNLLAGVVRDDLEAVGRELFNRLEEPALGSCPELALVKERLRTPLARGVLLSGSGSTFYVLAAPEEADGLARILARGLHRERLCLARPVGEWIPPP